MQRPIPVPSEYNNCFGCSPSNPQGLHLTFMQIGEQQVECRYSVPAHLCGAGTVAHGGIQATLLDEAMGFATRTVVGDDQIIVTAEFSLRYRRPVPIGDQLRVRGEVARRDGAHIFLRGVILDVDGKELTTAEARWKHLGPAPAASGPMLERTDGIDDRV